MIKKGSRKVGRTEGMLIKKGRKVRRTKGMLINKVRMWENSRNVD